jgi:serine/threonine-protein kinase
VHAPDTPEPESGAAQGLGRVFVGRYRVERVLGRGGMGEVLLAHDTLLRRLVALKHLRTDGPQAADMRHAILTEARRASQVSDHRIAAIHDVLDLGDDVLIVMEYVEGETLRERLREPMPLEAFWRLSRECVEALRAAHAQGVIHRDIKPENLMLTRGQEIKILDFGVALRGGRHAGEAAPDDSTTSIEQARRPAGTPRYMAPEAHYGGHIDERTDLFSLGAVFYEMLTARHPFAGGGYATVLDHIMNSPPEPASRVNPAVPESLSGVLERMLARDPGQRYPSCEEVAEALAHAHSLGTEPAPAAPAAAGRALGPSRRERRPTPESAERVPSGHASRVLALLGVAAAGILTWRVFDGPSLPNERTIAFLLPSTPGDDEDFAAFALGTVELLASRLARHQDRPGFQLQPFSDSRAERLTSVPDARPLLGANLAVVSAFEQRDNALAARLELREPVRGRRLGERTVRMPRAQSVMWADSLYRVALELLGLESHPTGVESDLGVRGAGTLRLLAQGIGRLQTSESEADLSRARDELETACQSEPEAALPRAWLATAWVKSYQQAKEPRRLEPAERSAREATEVDPDRPEGHRVLGETLVLLKRPREAEAAFRKACALDPARDEAWMGYGRSRRLLGDPAGERAIYEAAIASRPHAFRPRWWLAHWHVQQGHVDSAIAAYREMIRRAPDFSKGFSSLGGMLVQAGRYDPAIDTLRRALAIRPTANAYTNLGTAYFNTGRLNECVDAYNQAFQFGGDGYAHWFNLAEAYHWLKGRPDQATEGYANMVRLGRKQMQADAEEGKAPDPMIPANLATVFPKLGHPDSARFYLGRAIAIDSVNVLVRYRAALTHWQLGDRRRALDWLERAVAGGYPPAWLRDSPVHRDWRGEPRFTALLKDAGMAAVSNPSPGIGGR